MSRLSFEDLTPDDLPEQFHDDSGDRADAYMDTLTHIPTIKVNTMPMRTVDATLLQRPADAKIAHGEENARSICELVETLDDEFHAKGLDWMYDEQVAALWCADVEDTFGMLNEFVARMGLDADEVEHVAHELFDMLPTESQEQLRALGVWGVPS